MMAMMIMTLAMWRWSGYWRRRRGVVWMGRRRRIIPRRGRVRRVMLVLVLLGVVEEGMVQEEEGGAVEVLQEQLSAEGCKRRFAAADPV